MATTPVFMPGIAHGQSSLVGYSLWGCKESNTTQQLNHHQHQKTNSLLRLTASVGWRRKWQPTPVLLPGNSHGRRSLVGSSPWGRKESDTTERFTFTFVHWRRKWQPLQCSCLENPRDGGAWWAALYGVAQSRTQLKRLSSSISFS